MDLLALVVVFLAIVGYAAWQKLKEIGDQSIP